MNSEFRLNFAKAIESSTASDCHNYGITWGCDVDCPVLIRGECELQETENKELYLEAKANK